METEIIFIKEIINTEDQIGNAWIGKCFITENELQIYFNGCIYRKAKNIENYFDVETETEYKILFIERARWSNYHKGIVEIDQNSIEDYLAITKKDTLDRLQLKIVKLNNKLVKVDEAKILNDKYESDEDYSNRFSGLTITQLLNYIKYYKDCASSDFFALSKKWYLKQIKDLKLEIEKRESKA